MPQLPFDWYAGGTRIRTEELHYSEEGKRKVDLKAPEVVAKIRERFPDFSPSAYLNGQFVRRER